MLNGTGAGYFDGEQSEVLGHGSFEMGRGSPGTVWPTTQGIMVQDFRETGLGGILRRGGWRIEGGPLAKIDGTASTIELYGKSVWRVEPSMIRFGKSPPRSAKHSYEFFLLNRPRNGARAVVLKKWTIPPDRIPYDYYLIGLLDYDPGAMAATIKAVGKSDKQLFIEERVDLSSVFTR